jgi:long-chain acyl-CoA synthetase
VKLASDILTTTATMTNWKTVNSLPLHPVWSPPYNIQAQGVKAVEGETLPFRHFKAKDGPLERPAPGIDTAWDLMQFCVKNYGDRPAAAGRSHVKTHTETKKVPKIVDGETQMVDKEWTFQELSEYKYWTYKEFEVLIKQIGSGLRHLGLNGGDRVHIFCATRFVLLCCSASLYDLEELY